MRKTRFDMETVIAVVNETPLTGKENEKAIELLEHLSGLSGVSRNRMQNVLRPYISHHF